MSELHDLSAVEQAAAIRSGELTALELTEHYLARSHRLSDSVGAFVTLIDDLARTQAQAADQRAQAERRSGNSAAEQDTASAPLLGVVCPIKDLDFIADVPCSMGSAVMEIVPDIDENVVTQLRRRGMVFTGKTNAPELGLPCYTEPEIAPPARTPWDLTRSAGGSSGGSAAAVAAGLAPVAHGNDGGGSVRIPASVNGLVGIKPSRGRVSNGPLQDLVGDLVHQGPLARSVADAAALLDMMTGSFPGDPLFATGPTKGTFLQAANREPQSLRIGFYIDPGVDTSAPSVEVANAVEHTVDLLRDLGHQVDPMTPPFQGWMMAQFESLYAVLAAVSPLSEEQEAGVRPLTAWLRNKAKLVGGIELAQTLSLLRMGARAGVEGAAQFDAILAPTLARPPAFVGELRNDADPAADFAGQVDYAPYCAPYNVTGLPAMNVPLNWTDGGLPIGVQLIGRANDEETIISLAGQLERAEPWGWRKPDIW